MALNNYIYNASGTKVNKKNKDLHSFPTNAELPTDTTELYLDHNNITEVQPTDIAHLDSVEILSLSYNDFTDIPDLSVVGPTLESLYMTHNSIGELKVTSFQGLPNLQHLHLENSEISVIEPGTFAPLDSLKKLVMRGNPLADYPDMTGIGDSLQKLDFNKLSIYEIDIEQWNTLGKLTKFEAADNTLTEFPDIEGTTCTLMSIHVKKNSIREFPTLQNIGKTLQILDLSYNFIAAITRQQLSLLKVILKLLLNDNIIIQLPNIADVKGSLEAINLSRNPLVIDASRFLDYARVNNLFLTDTFIQRLPTLGANVSHMNLEVAQSNSSLDICHCDHLWLKKAEEDGMTVVVNDASCGSDGTTWIHMTFAELIGVCPMDVAVNGK